MAFFNFFAKKNKPKCYAVLKKLQHETEYKEKILVRLEALEKISNATHNRQKEMVIQLEDLDASINGDTQGNIEPLMSVADIVYDFYCYSKRDESLSLQARMMWQSTTAALKKAGIEVLEPTGETFSYVLHVAHATVSEPGIPHECITETLKCGYVFGDKILRRATVIVNKYELERVDSDEMRLFSQNKALSNEPQIIADPQINPPTGADWEVIQ